MGYVDLAFHFCRFMLDLSRCTQAERSIHNHCNGTGRTESEVESKLRWPSKQLFRVLRTAVRRKKPQRSIYKKGPRAGKRVKDMPSVAHNLNYTLSDEGASWIKSKWKCEDPFVVAGSQAAERLQTIMDGDKVTVIVV